MEVSEGQQRCFCVVVTRAYKIAGAMHSANEELQSDDGVDDDDKEDKQRDVQQGNHCLHYGV